jgi:hypothetical protein
MCRAADDALGSSSRVRAACFHAARTLFDSTVHRSGEASTSGPARRRLYRVPSRPTCAQLSPGAGLPGVSSLIATSSKRVHSCRGSQASAMFRPQAFSASRRFAPRLDFAGLFHPTATSRVDRPSRGFSPRAVPPSLRRALPPCRSTPGTHRPEAGCHTQAPRLRGFFPREGALRRPWGLATTPPRSPPRVFVPSRSSSCAVTTACATASALDVAGQDFRLRARPVQPTSAYCRRSNWPIHL